jgi:tetrahydromethanopterin:alpha-L-glutamate ligase
LTRIGIISAYPDEDWHAQQIARAAARHGEVRLLSPTDFGAELGPTGRRVTVAGEDARRYRLFLTPRAIGECGDAELQLELYHALSESGGLLVNDPRGLTTAIDKFHSSWLFAKAGLPTPRVVVAQRLEDACRALVELRRAVVKPLYGSLGVGIERIDLDEAARLTTLLERHRALYLQAFVDHVDLDVRAFVVGDRVAAAVGRRPRPGEFRANIHLGATAQEVELDASVVELAVRATHVTGLDYSGVDLLLTASGPQLLEVNGTPAFRGVNLATGRDMAMAIVEHAMGRAAERRKEQSDAGEDEGRHDRRGGGSEGRPSRRTARWREDARPLRPRVLRGDR